MVLAEFIEIREKNGDRIRGHQRQGLLARSAVLYAPFPISENYGRAQDGDDGRQRNPGPFLHGLRTICTSGPVFNDCPSERASRH